MSFSPKAGSYEYFASAMFFCFRSLQVSCKSRSETMKVFLSTWLHFKLSLPRRLATKHKKWHKRIPALAPDNSGCFSRQKLLWHGHYILDQPPKVILILKKAVKCSSLARQPLIKAFKSGPKQAFNKARRPRPKQHTKTKHCQAQNEI